DAKAALFTPSHAARGVLNADDPSGRALIGRAAIPVVTFGVDRDADLRASDVAVDARGISFRVEGVEVRSTLRGGFNVSNCLAARGATSSADLTVITTDNPRSEDPMAIIREIVPGAVAGDGEYVVEPDRRAAIRLAVREAKPGDIVVIAGKGHEPYQEVAGAA